ncbi:uncharacterized protein ARB_04436 [Trichophyton benhamiae CBS 112371]|uniref:Uncharacterized protein n=1 Tax=Arthroderma benhamiae (strain ATCC MYA-4681 / CBS 112371) TaxID=663331 RepID=D4AJI6_ARTBC|nr:uncharacterized protein ARB_04436 [Trichophyton benhamiae CBS 112371]EFE36909.1 hypothetical protein ARB_04436 [Trichophyton benhamiae CBS 112371]
MAVRYMNKKKKKKRRGKRCQLMHAWTYSLPAEGTSSPEGMAMDIALDGGALGALRSQNKEERKKERKKERKVERDRQMRILRIQRILLFPTQSTTTEYGPSDSSMGEADGSFAHESCGSRPGRRIQRGSV